MVKEVVKIVYLNIIKQTWPGVSPIRPTKGWKTSKSYPKLNTKVNLCPSSAVGTH